MTATKDVSRPAGGFYQIDDVPDEIKEFYVETQIEVGVKKVETTNTDEMTGEEYTVITNVPQYGTAVKKLPAYYENGGHISESSVAAWNYHDAYREWMAKCAEIAFSNSQELTDENGDVIKSEPMTLPPKPERGDYETVY